MSENTKAVLMLSVVGISYAALGLAAGLAGRATGYWTQVEPPIFEIVAAPEESITVAHRLCLAAIDAATDDEMLQCFNEADQMEAVR